MGPKGAGLLAETVCGMEGALRELSVADNPILGLDETGGGALDLEGLTNLCQAVGLCRIRVFDLSACLHCAAAVRVLGDEMSSAEVPLTELLMDRNLPTGSKPKHGDFRDGVGLIDVDVSGLALLSRWVGSSATMRSVSLSACCLGSAALHELTTMIAAGSSLTSLNIAHNFLLCGRDPATSDVQGFAHMCRALSSSRIVSWDVSGMQSEGQPSDAAARWPRIVASQITWDLSVLRTLVLDSTGVAGQPNTYTLEASAQTLDLSRKHLGPVDLVLLAAWLTKPAVRAALTGLDLSGNPLTGGAPGQIEEGEVQVDGAVSGGVAELARSFGKTENLTQINLSDCGLGPSAVAEFGQVLREYSLRLPAASLTVDRNPISGSREQRNEEVVYDTDLGSLAGFLESVAQSQFVSLSVRSCKLGPKAMEELAVFVASSPNVQSMVIDDNAISGSRLDQYGSLLQTDADIDGLEFLCTAMASSDLKMVSMQRCHLGPAALLEVAEFTRQSDALAKIWLCHNPGLVGELYSSGHLKASDANIAEFEEFGMSLHRNLRTLGLAKTGIGPAAAALIFEAPLRERILDHKDALTLEVVELDYNPIFGSLEISCADVKVADDFVYDAQQFLRHLSRFHLSKLSLRSTGMGPKACGALADIISEHFSTSLEELDVSNNPVFGANADEEVVQEECGHLDGWSRLCDVLSASHIQAFSAAAIGMTAHGCSRLAASVSSMLTALDISHNDCSLAGGEALSVVIPASSLRRITLGPSGTSVPVHDPHATTLSLTDQHLGPSEVTVVAACIG
eukprot:COSAG04_NODE_3598_length_2680_cov_1.245254_2_plen_794_part_01